MDEFHFYTEPDRGWAWQVPLLLLPDTQFLLMSATLGDTRPFEEDLTRRTGRETIAVTGVERPVPLEFEWVLTPCTRPSSCCCATTAARSTSCRSPSHRRSSRRRR
jgi:superfamily II RNA helicase